MPKRIVVGITGASGAAYAVRLLQVLRVAGVEIHLCVSRSGAAVIGQELGLTVAADRVDACALLRCVPKWSAPGRDKITKHPSIESLEPGGDERLRIHHRDDFMTPIASGSFLTDAMVICPCSGTTLSGISRAAANNLITRAAEVHLKEHRKLVLVPRETPLSVLQLENMQRLAAAGAVILPASPGWYHGVQHLDDLVDFVVGRILDQIGVDNSIISRWGE